MIIGRPVASASTISVAKAIRRGKWLVKIPAIAIFFTVLFISVIGQALGNIASQPAVFLSYVLPFLLAILYWSVAITRWRIWAFSNVRNVHELKKEAVRTRLIGEDHSIYPKFEFRTPSDRRKLQELQVKFDQKDVFEDDLMIPQETIIYYSKIKSTMQLALGCSTIAIGYLLTTKSQLIFGAVVIAIGMYLIYQDISEIFNTTPQIILNDKGIATVNTPFRSWSEIQNDEAISEGFGRSRHYYLGYEFHHGKEYLRIDDYNITVGQLNKLLIIYRGRFEN